MGAGLLHHRVREPAHVQNDLRMLHRAVMAAFSRQQTFYTDLSSSLLIGPVGTISGHEPFAVVLMHGGVDALLRVRRSCDQIDPKAVHGSVRVTSCGDHGEACQPWLRGPAVDWLDAPANVLSAEMEAGSWLTLPTPGRAGSG